MVAPLLAAEAAERAGKALTGDIYTRRTSYIVGKGKNQRLVENELRVNPVSIGLGVGAVGLGLLGVSAAVWAAQMRISPTRLDVNQKTLVTFVEGTATRTLKAEAPPKPLRSDYPDGTEGYIQYTAALAIWEATAYEYTPVKAPWCYFGMSVMDTKDFEGHEIKLLAPKLQDPALVSGSIPSEAWGYSTSPLRYPVTYEISGGQMKFAIKERRGFGIFTGDSIVPPEISDNAKLLYIAGSPALGIKELYDRFLG